MPMCRRISISVRAKSKCICIEQDENYGKVMLLENFLEQQLQKARARRWVMSLHSKTK